MQGEAGSGKSTLISLIEQWMERILRKSGDDPNQPYIIKTTFTGAAACIISGQTLHSAFGFKFGNEKNSLTDKDRDKKRTLLRNLKLVIIDEMSMIKADMLYQLDFRLKEIMQNINEDFGGVSIILLGDLLQLPPVQGRFIFEQPINPQWHPSYQIEPLWESFKPMFLTHNHRQGEDLEYANLLRRAARGMLEKKDIQLLQGRVRPQNHPDLPKDALSVNCKNKEVDKINENMLALIDSDEIIIEALHSQSHQKNFRPILDHGKVRNTPLYNILRLKIGAKVMLTYNVDVCDSLANGSKGEIIDFVIVKGNPDKIQSIIVEFQDEKAGAERRKDNKMLQKKYPNRCPTIINKITFEYCLSKNNYKEGSTANVVQFPLCLCFSSTAHKQQGLTIYRPNSLITDLRSVFTGAQAYVILGRVETKEQLFIIDELPIKKIYPNESAMKELKLLEEKSVNKEIKESLNKFTLHLAFLNVRSLQAHFLDVIKDYKLMESDLLLLGQTCLSSKNSYKYDIPGLISNFNNAGNGKGIAGYAKNNFRHQRDITEDTFQISKYSHSDIDVICAYRSSTDKYDKMLIKIEDLLNKEKVTIIIGDFNICYLKDPSNKISRALESLHFRQLVNEPTHEEGGCIDHLYFYAPTAIETEYLLQIDPAYYSDHDCLYLHVNVNQGKTNKNNNGKNKIQKSKSNRKFTEISQKRKTVTVKTLNDENYNYIKDIHRSTAKRKFSDESSQIPQRKKKKR